MAKCWGDGITKHITFKHYIAFWKKNISKDDFFNFTQSRPTFFFNSMLCAVLWQLQNKKKSINKLDIGSTHSFPMHLSLPSENIENRKVFWCFQGIEKGCIGKEWVDKGWNKKNLLNFFGTSGHAFTYQTNKITS